MARRPSSSGLRAAPKASRQKPQSAAVVATGRSHVDRLVAIVDHCTAAKDVADEIGERFLSYLLAMAIQESRTAMRRSPSPIQPED